MGRGMTARRAPHAGRPSGRGGGAAPWRSVSVPKRSPSSPAADVAETVLRLAVLLQAGVSPARAWEHLAHSGDPAAVHVASSIGEGMPLPQAIATAGPGAWREVGIACQVALVVGAPLAECLRGLAVALRDAHEAADDVRVALAEPAGTARLMSWLPLLAVGLGAALGFDTFGSLFTNPLGLACLAGGVVLIVVAQRWTTRLVRSAQTTGDVPGLDAELIAIALTGGVSIDRARSVVRDARALRGAGARTEEPGGDASAPAAAAARGPEGEGVDAVLALSKSAGVPAVELLRASAAHARHRARIDGRLRVARLSSRLLLPLGVCTLPAFLLLGVAPMMLSVMSTMSVSL
jgi:tight adherence protein B